jgi:protein TonB
MDYRIGPGLAGFNQGSGEGSGPVLRRAHGGGGGGNHDHNAPQQGELPPPSMVMAAIPIAPPVHPPALPVAGIDIDPALWKDLKAPVYGDPRSTSQVASKGPGEGEGIGANAGVGIGDGNGPGVGRGSSGNTGGGYYGQNGCCGDGTGGGGGTGFGRAGYTSSEVDQRARVLSKPEPQYTEEARRNQISGTVLLRAVFASSGEVVQIHALNALPFGLTERAIAAARQIKFVPAMKNGRAVSVYMQLEYNFNLY